jgi:hypothetical protein
MQAGGSGTREIVSAWVDGARTSHTTKGASTRAGRCAKCTYHRKLEYMGMEHVKSAAELYHHAEGVRDSAGHCRGRLAEVGRHRRSGGWGEFAVLR